MGINLLADDASPGINLLAEEPSEQSFYDLSPEDQEKALELAKQKISEAHPNMPDWLRDMILQVTPRQQSPMLESAARGVTDVAGYIPAAAGGLLQGASIPIRGAASMIPTEFTQNLANSPDLRGLFPEAQGFGQQTTQLGSELLGGGGLFGKLIQGLKGGASLMRAPQVLQKPLALGGAGYITTPGSATDKTLGAAGTLALGGAGKVAEKVANKLPEFMRGLASQSTAEDLVKAVQRPHDKLQSTADELYSQVRSAIKNRDIKIPLKDEHLNQVREILPKTRASQKLIEKAKTGDYDAVHDLQSHLYKKGTKSLASGDIALENQGEEILDLRDKINDSLERHLLTGGSADIAHVLKQGKKAVAELKRTYFNPALRKGIGKMVHRDLRLVPENPEKLFNQNSVPMREFLNKHPEVATHAKGIREKQEAMKALDSLFMKGLGAGGATFAGKTIYDYFK